MYIKRNRYDFCRNHAYYILLFNTVYLNLKEEIKMVKDDFVIYYKTKEKDSVEEQRLHEIIERLNILMESRNRVYKLVLSDDIKKDGNEDATCLIKVWLKPGFKSIYDISDILKLVNINEAVYALVNRIKYFSDGRYMHGYRIDWHTVGNCTYPVVVLDEQFDLFYKDKDDVFFDELDSALEYTINIITIKISDYEKVEDMPAINILTALKTRYEEVLIEYYMYKLSGETLQLDEA